MFDGPMPSRTLNGCSQPGHCSVYSVITRPKLDDALVGCSEFPGAREPGEGMANLKLDI